MLECPVNQAAGLIGLVMPSAPRMIAMVSHGDEQAELPLLWRLCWTLAELGYAVTVLDATTLESDANPGLDQLLGNAYWRGAENQDAPAWTVIPSGKGIQDLCALPASRTQRQHRLGDLFHQESIVILYSRVEWLVPILGESGVEPLLALSTSKTSLLTSYLALKRLLINGKLEPTIVNLTPEPKRTTSVKPVAGSSSLADCARNFLGYEVKAINIPASTSEDLTCRAIQRLALQLMENALSLSTDFSPMAGMSPGPRLSSVDRFTGRH